MINYLLEVSLCWLVFYLLYYGWLSRETFFQLNRWYLLGTLLLGLLLPLIQFPAPAPMQQSAIAAVYLQPIALGLEAIEITVTAPHAAQAFDWLRLLIWAYWAGVLVTAFRFMSGLLRIGQLYRRAEIIRRPGYLLALTDEAHLPFSFFNCIFKSRHARFTEFEEEKITDHEMAHIRGWHTLDVLLVEIAGIFLWCSPPVYLYRRSLRLVHEYLADAAATRTGKRKQYGHLLIRQSQSGLQVALANHFIHSQLKKRIKMMTKTKSRRKAFMKYLLALPILLMALMVFAQQKEKPAPVPAAAEKETLTENTGPESRRITITPMGETAPGNESQSGKQISAFEIREGHQPLFILDGQPITANAIDDAVDPGKIERIEVLKGEYAVDKYGEQGRNGVVEIYTKSGQPAVQVDEMPRFPGCEEVADVKEKEYCAQKRLLEHIYSNIKYPEDAHKAKVEGVAVASFVIRKDGRVSDASIVKGLGYGIDEEVLRVINAMPGWIPGRQKGQAVDVELKLPVNFRLNDETKLTEQSGDQRAQPLSSGREEIFKVVEEMPHFPGCEGMEETKDREACANGKLVEFIAGRIKYPEAARKAGLEGVVILRFVVEKDGSLSGFEITRDIGGGCGEEALRVAKLMPGWIPGKQRGRLVRVQINLPVRFSLPKTDMKAASAPEKDTVTTFHPQTYNKTTYVLDPSQNTLTFKRFMIDPNPTDGLIDLQFAGDAVPTRVRVLSASGQQIFFKDLPRFDGSFQETIDLSKAPRGNVYLTIQQGEKLFSTTIILQ